MEKLKECPNCKSNNLKDCYVYIRCNDCLMEGPKTNRGNYDDYIDHEKAAELWNGLPRKEGNFVPLKQFKRKRK